MLRSARKCLLSTDGFSCSLWASATDNNARVARRIFDVASAQLWLTEGVPFADAITMLEVRRRFELSPNECRVYAIETVFVAQKENCGSKHQPIANQEEIQNAVA
jgi:hypothetical protein